MKYKLFLLIIKNLNQNTFDLKIENIVSIILSIFHLITKIETRYINAKFVSISKLEFNYFFHSLIIL